MPGWRGTLTGERERGAVIETTFMHVDAAATALSTDVRTLLQAAAEKRIWLYGLSAELRETITFYEGDVVRHLGATRIIEYIPLSFESVLRLQATGETGPISWAGPLDALDGNEYWLLEDLKERPLASISLSRVFVRRKDIQEIVNGAATPPVEQPDKEGLSFFSDDLVLMIRAAHAYWKNACRDDPSTQHINPEVAAWLEQRGMSKGKAKYAASLIRPSWAHNGRKPES
ncbi:hypothetical protein [Methyloversatilis sp.]|uniref:hypothetical protein n=1 Tax=Methyloversatilis sp. TaxID=2569862 RepID=UPI002732FB9A|nr:hypothetical protein [Methyloversatilis sp.]MDP2867586.1 hypothetical protein [Methyloversatilis sp.]MDP3455993.1 hypothetical protein [Methyloversatilis sp.]MDP3579793.1 hypothetical protein [Methyloversatilis sp.]